MLFGREKPSREQISAVKEWARELLPVSPEASLMVSELECHEEGCPPIETVIAVLAAGQAPKQWKLHKPISAIERADIQQLAGPEETCGLREWRCPD